MFTRFSTIFVISGFLVFCQTTPTNTGTKNEEKILASQRKIIMKYLNSGTPSQAHGELRRVLRVYPDDTDFLALMGVTQLALRNHSKAVKYLRKAYRLGGKVTVGLNLSSALIASGKLHEAEQLLNSLLRGKKEYPKQERLYHNLGVVYEKRGNQRKAEFFYQRALEENPSYYLTLLKLGLLHGRSKRYAKAVEYLDKAKNFCRKCFEPVRYLSNIYLLRKNQQRAVAVVVKFSKQHGLSDAERDAAEAHLSRITAEVR